jgi:hypothetical protein
MAEKVQALGKKTVPAARGDAQGTVACIIQLYQDQEADKDLGGWKTLSGSR